MELLARERGKRVLHRRDALRHRQQPAGVVLAYDPDRHAKKEPMRSRSSGVSGSSSADEHRLEVRRARRAADGSGHVRVRQHPGERQRSHVDAALPGLGLEPVEPVVDPVVRRTVGSPRGAASSAIPPGTASPRLYLPASQPPASGPNGT